MNPIKNTKELYELFASVESEKEAKLLLKDLLTEQELDSISERWQIIKMLGEGISQRKISKLLGVSVSKITRGSRFLQYGGGGFKHFLKKLKVK